MTINKEGGFIPTAPLSQMKGKNRIKSSITNTLGLGKEKYKVEYKFTLKALQNLPFENGVNLLITWRRGKKNNGTSKVTSTINHTLPCSDSFTFPTSLLCDLATKKFEPKLLKFQVKVCILPSPPLLLSIDPYQDVKAKKTVGKAELNVADYIEYTSPKDFLIPLDFKPSSNPPPFLLVSSPFL